MRKTPFVIRQATPGDIPVVLRFIAKKAEFDGCAHEVETTEERLREALFGEKPLAGVLLGEVDGAPVAFASYFATYSTCLTRPGIWLDDLFVDAEWRSRGLGKALLVEFARMAFGKGVRTLFSTPS
jgi:GNAT superfamily N-acetyltransferase